jgi:ethanolamine ammonia-lyase small subunit
MPAGGTVKIPVNHDFIQAALADPALVGKTADATDRKHGIKRPDLGSRKKMKKRRKLHT